MDSELSFTCDSTSIIQNLLEPIDVSLSTTAETAISSTSSSKTNSNSNNEDRPWECEICGFRFKYKNNLTEHMRFYHMKGSVPCSICSEVFPTSKHLRVHRKSHAEQQGRCPHCRCTFPGGSSNPEVYREMYNNHLPDCRRCPAKMSSKVEKKCSLNTTHDKSYTWCCLVCCQKFSDLSEFESHECHSSNLTDFPTDRQELSNLLSHDINCQDLPYPEGEFPNKPPINSCNSSDFDYNFLCVICGINFENEEELNLHLYESHQTCDNDTMRNNFKNRSSEHDDEVSITYFVCLHCKKDFSDKGALNEHVENCKPQTDAVNESTQKSDESVITENAAETSQQLVNSRSDVLIPVADKVSSENLSDQNASPGSVDTSPVITEVPASLSPDLKLSPSSKLRDALLSDVKKTEPLEKQCNEATEDCSSTVIVQWLCKYCKVAFDSKGEMRTHKETCALKTKTSEPKNVLIRWVCKYCKKNFDTRESMCTHKKVCLLNNKDKSVLSSTESDISEIASREVYKNSFDSDFLNNQTEGEKPSFEKSNMHLDNESSKYETKDTTSKESEGILYPFTDQDEHVVVKWVCKYCKEDFEDRENMRCHKTVCKLRQKNSNVLYSSGSDTANIVISGKSQLDKQERPSLLNTVNKRASDGTKNTSLKRRKITVNCKYKDFYLENITKTKSGSKLQTMALHTCEICSMKFAARAAMKAHKLECHMFKCSRCGRYFDNNTKLWKHSRICRAQKASPSNKKKWVYNCKKCFRVFRERYKYNLHKLSCEHEMIQTKQLEEVIKVSDKNFVLRIQCSKCTGSYVGDEVFNLHTCDDPTSLEVFMDCHCGLGGFLNVPTLYSHCVKCFSSGLEQTKHKPISSRTRALILCPPCGAEFNAVFLYYLHLQAHPFCRINNVETNETESSLCQFDNESKLQWETHQSDDESDDWTCSFCKFIISASISRSMHYQMCKSKVCRRCGFFGARSKNLLKHNCSDGFKYMGSAKVVLERLPCDSVLEGLRRRQSQTASPSLTTMIRQVRVQRCVICYKKCKFDGVGLPPIGQLECFQCRSKIHRKELKKRGETFFSRSMFDTEESQPEISFQEGVAYSSSYLDPSKRLKISRALSKGKQSSQEMNLEKSSCFERQPEITHTTSTCRNNVLQKCSHCKRAFSSKVQLEKHMKLSKTCMHAETTKEVSMPTELRNSPIINFVDFITSGSRAVSFNQRDFTTSSQDIDSTSLYSHSQTNSCNSSIQNDTTCFSDHGSFSNNDESTINATILSGILSNAAGYKPSVIGTRTSYLVLEHVEKALNMHKQDKRVPISSALQCDGWILKSNQNNGTDGSVKSKYICGACFKSFSTQTAFTEHALTVHKLPPNSGIKLNIMRHIPKEALNKVSW